MISIRGAYVLRLLTNSIDAMHIALTISVKCSDGIGLTRGSNIVILQSLEGICWKTVVSQPLLPLEGLKIVTVTWLQLVGDELGITSARMKADPFARDRPWTVKCIPIQEGNMGPFHVGYNFLGYYMELITRAYKAECTCPAKNQKSSLTLLRT